MIMAMDIPVTATMHRRENKHFGRDGCALASLFIFSLPISAAGLHFSPAVSINERYSDNVTLTETNREAAFMTEIRPGFILHRDGARGQFHLDYGLQGLIYSHDSAANRHHHQLSAALTSHWLDKHFFMDAHARIAQQNTNASGPIGSENYNLTANRSETRSFSVSPAWQNRFDRQANLNLRWQLTHTDIDNASLSAATASTLLANLNSGSAFNQIPWQMAFRLQNSDHPNNQGDRNTYFSSGVSYIVSPKTQLNLTLGHDDNNGDTASFNAASGAYWNVGITWTPGTRTLLKASAGERYSGKSYDLNLTHRTRKSTWALRYNEDISDLYSQVNGSGAFDIYQCAEFPFVVAAGSPGPEQADCDGVTPTLILPAQIIQFPQIVNGYNLNQSWSGSASYHTSKSRFTVNLNKSQRKLLASNTQDSTQAIIGNWTLQLSPRLSSIITASTTHYETPLNANSQSESDDNSLAWTTAYRFSKQQTGGLEFKRLARDAGKNSRPYKENSMTARLNIAF